MLATGEKTPTPASRAAPSSSEPSSPVTKKAPVTDAAVDTAVGLEGDSSPGGKAATATGSAGSGPGSARTVVGRRALIILELGLGGSCVANEDLWEVEAVGSPRVRAMT